MILTRKIWTVQPRIPVELDLENSLVQQTTGLWQFLGSVSVQDVVTRTQVSLNTASSNYSVIEGTDFIAPYPPSSGASYFNTNRTNASLGISGSSSRTIYGHAAQSVTSSGALFECGTPTNQDWSLRHNGSATAWRLNIFGVLALDFTYDPGAEGTPFTFICTQNGSAIDVWINGASRATATQAVNTHNANFLIGGGTFWSSWVRPIHMLGVANRAWSTEEKLAFSDNPWQVYRPQALTVYFGSAAVVTPTGYANEALQAITEQATGRTGVVGQASEALQALSDTSTGRTGAVGRATEALQAITEQAYGFTQVNVTGFAADALQSITEASTGITGARGIAREAFQSLAESATGTVTSNAVQGYASEALQSITENSVGRTGVRGIASESLQAMTETARGITGVRGVGVEALQSLQDTGFGESGAEPIAPTRQFGAPAWWGYEGFDGTRRPWWYRDLKDKAAEAERQRQIRIDLGIISAAESKKIKQTIRQVEKFADEIPTPAKADAYIAKAEQMAEKIERLVDDLQEEDDEQAIMQMSRFFFHRKSPERRAYS